MFREAHRVLRPGGRFAGSDIVIRGDLDPTIRQSIEAWIGCVAGALEESEYHHGLIAAGFTAVEIEPTRVYTAEDAREFLAAAGLDLETVRAADGQVFSALSEPLGPDAAVFLASCTPPGRSSVPHSVSGEDGILVRPDPEHLAQARRVEEDGGAVPRHRTPHRRSGVESGESLVDHPGRPEHALNERGTYSQKESACCQKYTQAPKMPKP